MYLTLPLFEQGKELCYSIARFSKTYFAMFSRAKIKSRSANDRNIKFNG